LDEIKDTLDRLNLREEEDKTKLLPRKCGVSEKEKILKI